MKHFGRPTPLPTAAATFLALAAVSTQATSAPQGSAVADPRIQTVIYSPTAVVKVFTRRGQATQVVLGPDEELVGQPATGQGSNCENPADTWCVAVAPTLRDVFVKPRDGATSNTLLLITNRRRHAFELVPVAEPQRAAVRVSVVPPPPPAPALPPPPPPQLPQVAGPVVPPPLSAEQLISNRLRIGPQVHNGEYTVAEGKASGDLVPQLVFDDGRVTYFRFAGNLPLPAVFSYGMDGSEEAVNTRMTSGGLLVADRVARRFVLRAGNAVVAVINEAFDPEGQRPVQGTAVQGVARALIAQPTPSGRTPQ